MNMKMQARNSNKKTLSQVVWVEGTVVRSLKCEIVNETDNELTVDTLQKRVRIKKKWIIKIEEDLPENENENEDEEETQGTAGKRDSRAQY